MEIIKTLVWVVQIISAVSIIVLVLLQHGKGADAGATFGSGGGSGSLFGASGSANFLSRTTAIFAVIFFLSTFGMVFLANSGRGSGLGLMADYPKTPGVTKTTAPTQNPVTNKHNTMPE
jgi:preprotein translocase subunit SecG